MNKRTVLIASCCFSTLSFSSPQQPASLIAQDRINANDQQQVRAAKNGKLLESLVASANQSGGIKGYIPALKVLQYALYPSYQKHSDVPLGNVVFNCGPQKIGDPFNFTFPSVFLGDKSATWEKEDCTFSIKGTTYISPHYHINIITIEKEGIANLKTAVAFQNYKDASGHFSLKGKYPQPLNELLRTSDNSKSQDDSAIVGVNAGYDYRVDAWKKQSLQDNICYPRYSKLLDHLGLFTHPTPEKCNMGANDLPDLSDKGDKGCKTIAQSNYDIGDSLLILPQTASGALLEKQSYNCGGPDENKKRGAVLLYQGMLVMQRFEPKVDVSTLPKPNGEPVRNAVGAGPLLMEGGSFSYKDKNSEEGMPLDNYEVGGATGIGFNNNTGKVYLVTVDGTDNDVGLNNWMLGLFFRNQLNVTDALALGNGGDSTMWINPNKIDPSVKSNPEYKDYFNAIADQVHKGIVSNCTFKNVQGKVQASCNARPVHDGIFLYSS